MQDTSDRFDVFVSYHWRDRAQVERIAHALRAAGVRPFVDRWYLTPGRPWPSALESAISSCGAAAVFVGAEGLGPWQQREKDLALERQVTDPNFGVIPVLLPGAEPVLGF